MLLRKQLLPVPPRSHCSPMQPQCLGLDSAPCETRGRCSAGMGVCMAAHKGGTVAAQALGGGPEHRVAVGKMGKLCWLVRSWVGSPG